MEKQEKIQAVIQYFIEQHITVSAAESCTGGMICAAICDCPGVSEIFSRGYITYANEAKEQMLGVPHETLQTHGAVSAETACAMAAGVRRQAVCDVGICATGIAGPGGGTAEKPVGTVYIGISDKFGTDAYLLNLSGPREAIRRGTVQELFARLYTRYGLDKR